jgi:osmoprotectant transport system permease protein
MNGLWRRWLCLLLMLAGSAAPAAGAPAARPIVIASKPFGESYLLAEIFARLLESRGIAVERRPGLGSTEIIFQAMRRGAVDLYPEYTGTGLVAVLHDSLTAEQLADPRSVYGHVASAFSSRYGMRWLPPLGFENVYAIAVRPDTARTLRLASLSDLAREAGSMDAGFTADFIGRPDGLAGLAHSYGLHPRSVRPLSPALKYQALAGGSIDVVDGYSTDGLLDRYHLVVLRDDRHFFPPYQAAALLGPGAAARSDVVAALTLLSGRLDEPRMRALNRRVEVDGEPVARVAADTLAELGLIGAAKGAPAASSADGKASFPAYLWGRRAGLLQLALRHLWLVGVALAAAALFAIPLGLGLERARRASAFALGALGILQVIPSIALLAFMVPLLGIGIVPALVALWLYALYPIARGTYSGVRDADPAAVEAAEALGATPRQSLVMVRLPLAAPAIMAGVRTAAVITVGAATLAAFIGAGGLGEPIVEGLALADARMILSGALPAAVLALIIDFILARIERRVAPAHLRARRVEPGANRS